MNNKENILIIGAGLCGSLLALRLGQRGYNVRVMELRPDLRKVDLSAGRSINLAFSNRGLKAIKMVGLEDKVNKLCIPMHGRMLHDKKGSTKLSHYSGRKDEYINSISRELLTALLIDEAEALDNVSIEFDVKCNEVDFEQNVANFTNTINKRTFECSADLIFGTDGAGSALRKSYFSERKFLFSFSQNYLTHGYKELTIPSTKDGGFKTFENALHIWPRGEFMIIALPNLDGSFTVTLFLAYDTGTYNFNNLTTKEKVVEFFNKEFPDLIARPGGETGIDISPKGSDKSQIIYDFDPNDTLHFYGDRMDPQGNDYPLKKVLWERGNSSTHEVKDWKHTWELLDAYNADRS